jgi:hypothetical protein
MLKKDYNLLETIAKESKENSPYMDSLHKIYELDNFTLAISAYRFLGVGTIPRDEENISMILENMIIRNEVNQTVMINAKQCLNAIKSALKENNISLRSFIQAKFILNSDGLQITIHLNEKEIVIYKENTAVKNELTMLFNLKFLIHALEFINNKILYIGFSGSLKPVLINTTGIFNTYEQQKFASFMPMRNLQ